MRETTWTPASIAVAERVDRLLALILSDPGELTSVPLVRRDAHRIGRELIAAAALTPAELEQLEQDDNPKPTVLL